MTADSNRGIECPHCGGKRLRVKDSRSAAGKRRRRRRCEGCGALSTTYEIVLRDEWDGRKLAEALSLYHRIHAMPPVGRDAVLALVRSMAQPVPTSAGPLIPADVAS